MSPRVVATSAVVMVAGLLLCIEGLDLLRFESVEAAAQSLSEQTVKDSNDRLMRKRRIDEALLQLQPWASKEGFADRARRASGLLAAASEDRSRLETSVIDLLATEPASGRQWLALAQLRWRRGAPMAEVLGALQMSNVTEPREANTMSLRLPFVLRLWELLPEDEQRLAVNQLVELRGRLDHDTLKEIRAILATKSEATREALRAEFAARGVRDRAWWHAIGL